MGSLSSRNRPGANENLESEADKGIKCKVVLPDREFRYIELFIHTTGAEIKNLCASHYKANMLTVSVHNPLNEVVILEDAMTLADHIDTLKEIRITYNEQVVNRPADEIGGVKLKR
ncbi:uncharacterized protein LOC131927665 [Physella acuta]|uniref:uncharacterized protein LOC131927665 n=1 Tax=Physella acuta TaxID=109671 RepID=UPI0027DD8F89|nr:uncharacterized protein LOC131927665 [Physella acuta]